MTEDGTPGALLDAAEVAFAEHGIDNVSLRAIMRAAGVNAAAVHYHYGSREALARAVLDRVLAPLQARRLELLDGLVDGAIGSSPPLLTDLVEALVRPDFEAAAQITQRHPGGGRLIGAIYVRPSDFVKSLVEASFAPVAARFQPHLEQALPTLDPGELAWRLRWGVFGSLGALLSDDASFVTAATIDHDLTRFVAMTVGALTAPTGSTPDPVPG